MSRTRTAIVLALMTIVTVGFTMYLWGPLRTARWDVLDDHEIAYFVGPGGRLPIRAIPGALWRTAVVDFNAHTRLRPTYTLLRLVESSLWGLNPSRWFRARQVLFGVTLFITLIVGAMVLGPLAAVLGTSWVLCEPYWPDIWARLGPSEGYAAFGLALWVSGIAMLWRGASRCDVDRRVLMVGTVALLVGFLLASGAKENFLILALPMVVMLWADRRGGRATRIPAWAVVVGLLWTVMMVSPLIARLAFTGVDVYQQSVSIDSRALVLLQGIRAMTPLHWATVVSFAFWVGTWLACHKRSDRAARAWRRLASQLLGVSVLLLVLYSSQDVFYNGALPTGTRYDFPALLMWPIWMAAAGRLLRRFFKTIGASRLADASWHGVWIIFLGLLWVNGDGLAKNRAAAAAIADHTRQFTAQFMNLVAAARRDPARPIVITSHDPMDFEPVWSLSRFLDAHGIRNTRFLYLVWDEQRASATPLARRLAEDLRKRSEHGDIDHEPIGRFQPDRPCLSVGLSGEPLATCVSFGRLYR